MRIFGVGNKNHVGFWCAAPDAETARDIAFSARHARKRENLTVVDVTVQFEGREGIAAILAGDRMGRVTGRGDSVAAQVLRGEKPQAARWVIAWEWVRP